MVAFGIVLAVAARAERGSEVAAEGHGKDTVGTHTARGLARWHSSS